jgi:hypothetical protein
MNIMAMAEARGPPARGRRQWWRRPRRRRHARRPRSRGPPAAFHSRRLSAAGVADDEQRHQAEQQGLALDAAGERGQDRRAEGDAERVDADDQAGQRQGDAEVTATVGNRPTMTNSVVPIA